MKTVFFEARYSGNIDFPEEKINELPEKIILFTTVQFIGALEKIKILLEKKGKKVSLAKVLHSKYEGQILGCNVISKIKESENADAFLYLGDGLFHPMQLLLKNSLPVFVFNPSNSTFFEMKENDVEKIKKRIKGSLLKFHSSEKIGIIVSTKPGQNRIELARKIKKKLEEEKKEVFLFIADTIDFSEMENFPFIEIFINTACPRIAYDDYEKFEKSVIDIEELPDEYKK
jgi:2-(3-amino-3-carboxypropyl)histidine synthase